MTDTIAAIATAHGTAAIGIIRLSGPNTLQAVDAAFSAQNGKPAAAQPKRKMLYGKMHTAAGDIIDDGLCVLFPAGGSYTGEASAELYCHGAPVVLNEVLAACFAGGARQAKGGEFTKRAFLSGRMDLIQAEAVADLIDAETPECAQNAAAQLSGQMSQGVAQIYDRLMDVLSRFYAAVDYPDEEIEPLEQAQLLAALAESGDGLRRLLATFERGRILKQGLPTVLLGRPNAGKSSLLNALLGYDRAIVTDVAGTTRDTVEEKVRLGHLLLRLCDTAGIRKSADTVEQIGVARAQAAAGQAQLALLVLDGAQALTAEDEQAIALAEKAAHCIVLVNKSDLPQTLSCAALSRRFETVLSVSARTGEGLDALTEAVCKLYPHPEAATGSLLTNARQADAVGRALEAIERAQAALENGMTADVVLTDGEEAMAALGELTGKRIREDLVATIFSRFCVGK